MSRAHQAPGAYAMLPSSEEALAVAAAKASLNANQNTKIDYHGSPYAGQALRVIEDERTAAQYLACLQAQRADPDELALIVSMLYGTALHGAARFVGKTLRGASQ